MVTPLRITESEEWTPAVDCLQDYLLACEGTHKPSSIIHKRSHLRQFVYWLTGQGLRPADIRVNHVRKYLAHRQVEGAGQTTRYHDVTQLDCFYTYLRRAGHVPSGLNPCEGVKVAKPKTKRPAIPTEKDLEAMLSAVKRRWSATSNRGAKVCYPALRTFMERQDYATLLLLYETGARSSEVRRLKRSDVHLFAPSPVCPKGRKDQEIRAGHVVYQDTKTGEDRAAPVSLRWAKAYASWLNVSRKIPTELVFCTVTANEIGQRNFSTKVKAYAVLAGCPHVSPQWFRRFRTSRLADYSPRAAAQICGHSLEVIDKHYLGEEWERNADAWSQSLGGSETRPRRPERQRYV